MSVRVTLRRLAELEFNRAIIWYEENQQGLVRDFRDEFKAMIATIRERPRSFPIEYRDLHKASLSRFPYKIYFKETDAGIIVVAVLHASQRTSRLRGRH